MLDYDPVKNLSLYPIPMERFGKNPYGENLWRVVWAPSRRVLAGDDSGFHWVHAYRQAGPVWILEKWVDPFTFCQMTREKWDREMLVLGPYPSRGEYIQAHIFGVSVADANLDKLIAWIDAGRQRSYAEHLTAAREEYAAEEAEASAQRQAIIRNALPAFGTSPVAGYGGGSGTKTRSLPYVARGWQPKPGVEKTGGAEHKFSTVRSNVNQSQNVSDHCR